LLSKRKELLLHLRKYCTARAFICCWPPLRLGDANNVVTAERLKVDGTPLVALADDSELPTVVVDMFSPSFPGAKADGTAL
jgi:hypothetical protein